VGSTIGTPPRCGKRKKTNRKKSGCGKKGGKAARGKETNVRLKSMFKGERGSRGPRPGSALFEKNPQEAKKSGFGEDVGQSGEKKRKKHHWQ